MPRLRRTTAPESANDANEELQLLKKSLKRAQATQLELRELIEQITAAPWYPALYQGMTDTPDGSRAIVWMGGTPRLVNLHPEVEAAELLSGQYVYLDHELTTLMAPSLGPFAPPADAANFERSTVDGRLLVRSRGEELVLECSDGLNADDLSAGQMVLFDRPSRMALEMMEESRGDQYQLEEVGDLSRNGVGGRRESFDDLVAVLSAGLLAPELAQLYQLGGRRAVLLYGPPGCGKTLMARTAASEIERLSGEKCYFAVVRPGEFESAYVGESEANIRNCFRALREAAGDGMAILFLDEIESIGRIRGSQGARHADRFLAALLAEIDGFCERGQVSILAATNRRDLLDPALLSRFSDKQIAVPRPNLDAAREILGIHLPDSIPYASHTSSEPAELDSREMQDIRCELIDTAISHLYAPNADNEICRLGFRDGTSRTVHARELMSGRLIEQMALSVREKAFRRHHRGERPGLCVDDAVATIESSLVELSTTLSIHNVRAYLDDLPQDVDVVRVDPIRQQPERKGRFYNAS